MVRAFLRRCLRSTGWWLADGAIERFRLFDGSHKIFERLADGHSGGNGQLEPIRVHTWLSKEFEALAFEDALLAEQLRKFGPTFVAKYNTHLFSQTYEDAAIAEIFSRIGINRKTFIEIGVENGSENTTRLLLALGWKGLWIEGNGSCCDAIRRDFSGEIASGQLQVIHSLAEPDNVQSLIESAKLGLDVDFLSIDVDQHTSYLFRAITTRSRAACVEYNAHFPPTIEYEVPHRKGVAWDGSNWFGASLQKLVSIATEKDMALVGCDLFGVNAYFVDRALTGDLFPKPFTAEYHYQPPRYPFVRGQRGHMRRAVQPGPFSASVKGHAIAAGLGPKSPQGQ